MENSRRRDLLINDTGEAFGHFKRELDEKKVDLEQHKQRLEREKENNRATENDIQAQDRLLAQIREKLSKKTEEKESLNGEVQILRNQLSAFATELNNKRTHVAAINTVLAEKMQRLEAAKKKFAATKERLGKELAAQE